MEPLEPEARIVHLPAKLKSWHPVRIDQSQQAKDGSRLSEK